MSEVHYVWRFKGNKPMYARQKYFSNRPAALRWIRDYVRTKGWTDKGGKAYVKEFMLQLAKEPLEKTPLAPAP